MVAAMFPNRREQNRQSRRWYKQARDDQHSFVESKRTRHATYVRGLGCEHCKSKRGCKLCRP